MKQPIFTIIDIETTGGLPNRDKITEIAIIRFDGEKIIDTYETLINPERSIPFNITQITGITQEMVENAPKFYEVAKEIVLKTEGTIFVAHNVSFDYNFIREEFARLGFAFSRKQLCTVKLARKTFTGLKSYSLGNLIKHFGIVVKDRHRAMVDAMATTELFKMILDVEKNKGLFEQNLHLSVKETRLPDALSVSKIMELPEACGVYYMYDESGTVVYVGKSINIRKRIFEHFADNTSKATKLKQIVHDISFELTGSELVALLLESYEIKKLNPKVNKAQKNKKFSYGIFSNLNKDSYLCLTILNINNPSIRNNQNSLNIYFSNLNEAKAYLKSVVKNHQLCLKWCGLDDSLHDCFYHQIALCKGACCNQETPQEYNSRVNQYLTSLKTYSFENSILLMDTGRNNNENAVIQIEEGRYIGFGYVSNMDSNNIEDLKASIKPYKNTTDAIHLIRQQMFKSKTLKVITIKN